MVLCIVYCLSGMRWISHFHKVPFQVHILHTTVLCSKLLSLDIYLVKMIDLSDNTYAPRIGTFRKVNLEKYS